MCFQHDKWTLCRYSSVFVHCSDVPIIREVDFTTTSTRTKFLCTDIFISCVIPWFLFVIIVEDGMEMMSRSSMYKNETKKTAIYHCRSRTHRSEILTSLLFYLCTHERHPTEVSFWTRNHSYDFIMNMSFQPIGCYCLRLSFVNTHLPKMNNNPLLQYPPTYFP